MQKKHQKTGPIPSNRRVFKKEPTVCVPLPVTLVQYYSQLTTEKHRYKNIGYPSGDFLSSAGVVRTAEFLYKHPQTTNKNQQKTDPSR